MNWPLLVSSFYSEGEFDGCGELDGGLDGIFDGNDDGGPISI